MLIEFRVENHRSIRDEQVLSMEAARIGDESDGRPREIANHATKLLPVVAIYGANGSGKSNVLAALAYMKEAVSVSHRFWGPDEGLPRDPFAWGDKRGEPSLYEVQMIIEGVRYQYGFMCNDDAFLEEWIYAWPNGKKQTWLEREGESFKFGENLRGENKVIEEVTRPNALYLSAAAQLRHPQLSPLFSWFGSIHAINLTVGSVFSRRLNREHRFDRELAYMLEDPGEAKPAQPLRGGEDRSQFADQFKALLQAADIGIEDVRLSREEASGSTSKMGRGSRFELKHRCESNDAWLPLDEESRGNKNPVPPRFADPPGHPDMGHYCSWTSLSRACTRCSRILIVRQFNDPEINKNNAQLIFSTHDTNLLGTLVGEAGSPARSDVADRERSARSDRPIPAHRLQAAQRREHRARVYPGEVWGHPVPGRIPRPQRRTANEGA